MNASLWTENSTWTLEYNISEKNGTDKGDKSGLFIALNALSIFVTYSAMFFMGCEVKWCQIKGAFKFWKYLLLGMVGQFLIMPATGYLAIMALNIKDYYGAGITIITCSPGGGYSNLLTYLYDGEVWLSVVLTTISTALAFGIMPLNLWLYSGQGNWSLPYLNMLIVLILLNVALVLGMMVRWKAPGIAEKITKFGVVLIAMAHVSWLVIWFTMNPTFLTTIPWKLGVAILIVMGIGLTSISLIAGFMSCSISVIKTLAIETVYQSLGAALTISLISFQRDVLFKVQSYIMIYCFATTSAGLFTGGLYQLYKWTRNCNKESIFFWRKPYSIIHVAEHNTEDNTL